jgi:hypothetical protein
VTPTIRKQQTVFLEKHPFNIIQIKVATQNNSRCCQLVTTRTSKGGEEAIQDQHQHQHQHERHHLRHLDRQLLRHERLQRLQRQDLDRQLLRHERLQRLQRQDLDRQLLRHERLQRQQRRKDLDRLQRLRLRRQQGHHQFRVDSGHITHHGQHHQ